jgi:hypothetical protein
MRRTVGVVAVSIAISIGMLVTAGAATWVSAQSGGTARTPPGGAPRPLPAEIDRSSGASALQGAWTVQNVSFAKPPVPPLNKPVGVILFSGNHYALAGADAARSDFPPGVTPDKATADQLRATWGSVVSEGGTFTVNGDTLRFSRTVAKGPAAMAANNFSEQTFTLNGDTLTLIQTRNQGGPVANPATIRLTRAK